MSDVIAGLRRDLEERLKDIERQLAEHEPLLREREQIQAALAQPPFASGARPAAVKRAPAPQGGRGASVRRGARTATRSCRPSTSVPARARPSSPASRRSRAR